MADKQSSHDEDIHQHLGKHVRNGATNTPLTGSQDRYLRSNHLVPLDDIDAVARCIIVIVGEEHDDGVGDWEKIVTPPYDKYRFVTSIMSNDS
jgi:hypothetical protein